MRHTRANLFGIWLIAAVLAAFPTLLLFRSMTRVSLLAGRTDPSVVWSDPTALFTDPGLLGTAVELRVTAAVRHCMAAAGHSFRGPAAAPALDSLVDPGVGYGVAAGEPTPRPILGDDGPSFPGSPGYEAALYGLALAAGETGGGCAASGLAALGGAVAILTSFPYPLDQLQSDAIADPAYQEALADWRDCMALQGHTADSPEGLMADLAARLAVSQGDAGRALAEEERAVARDDFACRARTIDAAMPEIAARLAPAFVAQNSTQLERLIPRPAGTEDDLPTGLGTGDVQVTLVWSSRADLDLSVTGPDGEAVFYGNPSGASGGTLDRDANFPCNSDTSSPAVENVFWPEGKAPAGSYVARIVYTSDCAGEGPQSFRLVIRVEGAVVHDEVHTVTSDQGSVEFAFTREPS